MMLGSVRNWKGQCGVAMLRIHCIHVLSPQIIS